MECINDILRVEGIMSQGFGLSPKIVMRDQRLTIEAKAIYSYIVSFAGGGNQSFPGRDMMVEELGISVKRYYKHLQLLIECDYLRIEREKGENGMFGRNIYTIVANPASEYIASENVHKEKNTIPKEGNSGEKYEDAQKPKTKKKAGRNIDGLRIQLGIDDLIAADPGNRKDLELILSAVKDMAASRQIKVAGAVKDHDAIMDVLSQLRSDHVRVVLKALHENRKNIRNIRTYLQACIVNCIYEDVDSITEKMDKAVKIQRENAAEAETVDEKKKIFETYPQLKELDTRAAEITMKICQLTFTGNKTEKEKLQEERKKIDLQIEQFCQEREIALSLLL